VSELVTHGAGEPKIEKSTRDSLVKLAGAAPPSSTLFKANGRICALTALTILSASASVGATKRGASARKFERQEICAAHRAAGVSCSLDKTLETLATIRKCATGKIVSEFANLLDRRRARRANPNRKR
jgi:hypothetical protein